MSGKTAEPHRLCCVFPNRRPNVIYEEYGPHLWLLLFMGDVILYWNAFKCAPHTQAVPVDDYILKITTCSESSFLGHQQCSGWDGKCYRVFPLNEVGFSEHDQELLYGVQEMNHLELNCCKSQLINEEINVEFA